MKSFCACLALFAAWLPAFPPAVAHAAQNANQNGPTVVLQGLRSSGNKGSFKAAQYAPDGSLILLYDGGDGLRLFKVNASANTIQAQAKQGAAGDSGLSMALDAAGNIYVAGTSTSGSLAGTPGVPFPSPVDTSTNSFLARFDSNLNLTFLTFLGAGRTAVAAVAATADAVFVSGVTYSTSLPVTSSSAQPAPGASSTGNGFVERFSPEGTTLVYATYLTGANGDTVPSAITADASDNVYVTGQTSAADFPVLNALVPQMLGTSSGFLSRLTPAGDAFAFSTFLPGTGLTSLTLDAQTQTLLLTGDVALGQFPVATVGAPIVNTPYQSLLRLSEDGQTLLESVLLAPGAASFVTAGADGTAWVSETLSTPLPSSTAQSNTSLGDLFLLHVAETGVLDQTLRFGGVPVSNAGYASLATTAAAPAMAPDGSMIALPGTVTATASASLAATERFDLPLAGTATAALPNAPADLLPSTCTGLSQCTGSGGLLSLVASATANTALSLSTGDLPNLILRNVGAETAETLAISATGFTVRSDCANTLSAGAQCSLALTGAGLGSISVTAANAATITATLPAITTSPDALAFDQAELDFGIVTPDRSPVTRSITVTNFSTSPQAFSSALDAGPSNSFYTLAETSSTCGGISGAHTVPANASCTVILGLAAASSSTEDSVVQASWKLGSRDLRITGITQASALTLSATEVDFGLYLPATAPLPRYLYLSNSSSSTVAHTPVSLPSSSPFTVTDACPSLLGPGSVCQITLSYAQTIAPSFDSTTLTLDQGLSALVTGQTQSAPASTSAPAASISASTTAVVFAAPTPVTGLSAAEAVTLTNTGSTALPLAASITGDFLFTTDCAATLNPGASCGFNLQFAPSQPGTREGQLSLNLGTGYAPLTIALTGTGSPLLSVTNASLALGQTPVGEPVQAWYSVSASLPALTASVSNPAFGVALVQNTGSGHGTLPASAFTPTLTGACENCWLVLQFLPSAVGSASSGLTLSSVSGGNPYKLSSNGTGLPTQGLVLTAPTQDFGTVPVGSTSAPITFTLTDLLSPAAPVTIQSVAATGDFQIVQNTTGGASCTGSLSATASCFVELAFTPTLSGARSGTLTINTSGGNVNAALSGSAITSTGLSLSPTSLAFSNQPGTDSTRQTVTLTNTGTEVLTIGLPASSDASFAATSTCTTLVTGATCTVTVVFTPGTVYGSGSLTILVTPAGFSATTYTVPLSSTYTASQVGLLLLPNQANFGPQAAFTLGGTRQFTLTNTASQPQNISLTLPQQFPLAAPASCGQLAAGASCTFAISFLPVAGGPATGTLVATATGGDGTAVQALGYLLGYGAATGTLTISGPLFANTPLNFGQVTSGNSAQQTLTLTNAGSAPLHLARITSASPFLATSTCGQALAPAASCTVTLTYAPVFTLASNATSFLPRTDAGTLFVDSDAASSPDQVSLTGTAAPVTSSASGTAVLASYTLSEGALTFANTQVGDTSASQTITLGNSGSTPLAISGILPPTDFSATSTCSTVQPAASCAITVTFNPGASTDATVRSGTLEIQSNASNPLDFVSLLGLSSPSPLSLSPITLDFGNVSLDATDQLSVNATNTASLPITFGQLSATGDYTVANGTCPAAGAPLAAGQSCAMVLTFAPATIGTRTGTLAVATDATQNPLTVALTGTGQAPDLVATPGALAFGSISTGASAILPLGLHNSGTAALGNLSSALSGPAAADFAITTPCPATALAVNAGCTLQVTFTPSALGARTATLTLSSSNPAGPVLVALSGSGTQRGGFALTVNGASAATAIISAGMPATYSLLVTPESGYTGSVALTCTPLTAGPYAACSLLGSQMTLGSSAQSASATITTVESVSSAALWPLGLLSLTSLSLYARRRRPGLQNWTAVSLIVLGIVTCSGLTSCSGGNHSSGQNLTPPGTYQYTVTASSTSGVQLTSTVTLTMVVQ